MRLTPGKFVVHPQHGPAEVVSRSTKKIKGEDVDYVVLEVQEQRLQIAVPESSLSEIGVRDLSSHTRLRKLMSLLAKDGDTLEKQWSRRLKALREKLATGDLDNVAEVARDLYRRQKEKELSMAERNLYQEAKDMIIAEVALVLDVDHDEAERTIDGAIDGVPLTRLGLDRGKESKEDKEKEASTA
ncbi:CarD family transcriptional regulator [Auritidibacter ignavus]|uniref:CarD family transcriptional regulator n=1 Tax=Auritidibacter ignavus TaxID=678932 RepID=UPI00109CA76C|nr:CarD family transcriptional regulator [Auritidibacter ignavus]